MAVSPYEEPVDQDLSVMPDTGAPCVFCNSHQWVHGAVRLLNAAAGYNPFTVRIDNQLAYTGLNPRKSPTTDRSPRAITSLL